MEDAIMSKYTKMIDKYAPQIMELRNMDADLAECKSLFSIFSSSLKRGTIEEKNRR